MTKTQQLILQALQVKGEIYGLELFDQVKLHTRWWWFYGFGRFYADIRQLEKAGWIEGEFRESPDDELLRGGARRRFYRLTKKAELEIFFGQIKVN